MDISALETCFRGLANESRELYIGRHVQELRCVPEPLEFYRNYVSANQPVVVRGAVSHWPAIELWTTEYLRQRVGSSVVTVAVTPDGYADAVHDGVFVTPAEQQMTMSQFLDIIDHKTPANGVIYIQKQNSNFTDEFNELSGDVDLQMAWAAQTFGTEPDAVNFWCGDGRAVTSLHKDHYENIYCVVSGQKTFLLIPPTDQPFVPYELYQQAVYKENEDGHFDIITADTSELVPWIAVDPLNPDTDRYPEFANVHPLEVTVGPGDILYLPSLWFHHVRQTHACIAVNFWYDMAYDIRYCYYKFVESLLSARLHSSPSSSTSAAASESVSVMCSCGRSRCTCRTDTVDFAR